MRSCPDTDIDQKCLVLDKHASHVCFTILNRIRFLFLLQVVMVVSSDRQPKPNEKIPHKTFEIPYKAGFNEDLMIRPALEENKYKLGWNLLQIQLVMCESLLNSNDTLWELKSFDLIVFGSTGPCGVLVSQLLGIPSVTIVIGPPNQAISTTYHMVPLPLSYVPIRETGFPSKMTFVQRVVNSGIYSVTRVILDLFFVRSFDALKAKFNIKPERSFEEGLGDTELVIFVADFALEVPQPLLPG